MSLLRRTEIEVADGRHLDAFNRLRVSQPTLLFDSQFTYDEGPLLWDTIVTTGGSLTHLPNEGSVQLVINTTSGASIIRQTKQYHRYQPGKSHEAEMTFAFGSSVVNVRKQVGYFDDNNGFFLRQASDGVISIVYRTKVTGSVVDTVVPQSSWNVDKMDGSGPSKKTMDFTKSQNMLICLQALYVGRVRVGFYVDGLLYYCHHFNLGNLLGTAYITTASLPVRYQVTATGVAAGAASMRQICCMVSTEAGALRERGFQMSADTVLTSRNFGGTPLPILAVRPKTTFNSIANKGQMLFEGYDILPVGGTAEFRFRLLYNPVITGGTWVSVDASSIAEYNITGTALTGGIPISSGYIWASSGLRLPQSINDTILRYPWCLDGAGQQITFALSCTDVSGTSDVQAAMQWRELR